MVLLHGGKVKSTPGPRPKTGDQQYLPPTLPRSGLKTVLDTTKQTNTRTKPHVDAAQHHKQ